MTINKLYKIIKNRQAKMPKDSYTASLFRAGKEKIISKVKEETAEVILAAKKDGKDRVISETADLCFHILIMLAKLGIKPKEILD